MEKRTAKDEILTEKNKKTVLLIIIYSIISISFIGLLIIAHSIFSPQAYTIIDLLYNLICYYASVRII